MKNFATLLTVLIAIASSATAQIVHPAGATNIPINWQANTNPDSVRLDLDNDQVADVAFRAQDYIPNPPSAATRYFRFVPLQADVELAADSLEYDSAHRFQAGELLNRSVRWAAAGNAYRTLFVSYFLTGNGGTGGRGFFRDGQAGYVAVRKPVPTGGWNYWWVQLQVAPSGVWTRRVNFYGSSAAPLATTTRRPAAGTVYPNPTTDRWQLPLNGTYWLRDATGRVVRKGQRTAATPYIDAQDLPIGLYWLECGGRSQRVSKQ